MLGDTGIEPDSHVHDVFCVPTLLRPLLLCDDCT